MSVKQISVFLENAAGELAKFTDVLSKHGIDMRALSIAETRDFGILRIIVNDPEKTGAILKEEGYVFSITPVIAVAVSDEPGSLVNILHVLGENNINLEYTYAFITRKQQGAYLVFRVEDTDKAVAILAGNKIPMISQEEVYAL